MIKFQVDDNFTKYLEELEKNFDTGKSAMTEAFTRSIVGNYGSPISGHIAEFMSQTFNPYLFTSGQDENYWNLNKSKGKSVIEVLYSGMHLHNVYPPGKARVWWEFGKEGVGGRNDVLERDYAYYQETGRDKLAKSEDAKHQGAIEYGLLMSSEKDLEKTAHYLELIMKGRTLGNNSFIGYKR